MYQKNHFTLIFVINVYSLQKHFCELKISENI